MSAMGATVSEPVRDAGVRPPGGDPSPTLVVTSTGYFRTDPAALPQQRVTVARTGFDPRTPAMPYRWFGIFPAVSGLGAGERAARPLPPWRARRVGGPEGAMGRSEGAADVLLKAG
ncbi:hypothetical protein [Nonomuraea dietziae]|uniref:hypothetical protein n=1 Tax=Nonomuraea dietziae TaxID=65515 RepID=UPI003413E509